MGARRRLLGAVGLLALLVVCSADSCDMPKTANDAERDRQERVVEEGNQQIGMPGVVNFQEKRLAKMLYELRDQANLNTYTYLAGEMNGTVGQKICDSVGFGLPYAVQFSAPESEQEYNLRDFVAGHDRLPQPEPNGLFMPASAEGTWVMCRVPGKSDVQPTYIEPRVIVSLFPLR